MPIRYVNHIFHKSFCQQDINPLDQGNQQLTCVSRSKKINGLGSISLCRAVEGYIACQASMQRG